MKISIIGDSFSTDDVTDSWINLLAKDHKISLFSQRGISEFKIFLNFKKNFTEILSSDVVIIWHTNPDRVYVNDLVDLPTRKLESHKNADMIASDICDKKNWTQYANVYYKYFYNQSLQDFLHQSVINEIRHTCKIKKLIECSGFDLNDANIQSFNYIKKQYPGNINHFDLLGNKIVFDWINSKL